MKLVRIKEKSLNLLVALFFCGVLGLAVGLTTDFKYELLNIISFVIILPMCNVWIWQWLEDKKDKRFANTVVTVTVLISIFAAVYVLSMGGMGKVPILLLFCCSALFFGWLFFSLFFGVEKRWQKLLVILAIPLTVFAWWSLKEDVVEIKVNYLSDIAYMDVFENVIPPIIKQDIIKQKGVPFDIRVEHEYDDDNEYEVEVLEYLRDGGKIYIIFIDKDYEDGYIQYKPNNLDASIFLKDDSYIKEKPRKPYTIEIKDIFDRELEVSVGRDNKIESILYYSDYYLGK